MLPASLFPRLSRFLVVAGFLMAPFSAARAATPGPTPTPAPTPTITLKTLHTFHNLNDGSTPYGGLVLGKDGNLYGTTSLGGTSGQDGGTVFSLTPDGTLTTLASFPAGRPLSTLAPGLDHEFYGATSAGGKNGGGFIFRVATDGTLSILGAFAAAQTGDVAYAGLLQGGDSAFYGTTTQGAGNFAPCGAIFRATLAGTITDLHVFKADGSEGTLAYGTLVQGFDGNFYGTATQGGAAGVGTVFKVTPLGLFSVLHVFTNGADGGTPRAGLLLGSDGNFYGTTSTGATGDAGTVFQLTPAGVLTTLHSFNAAQGEGVSPAAPLVNGGDGNLYGTTLAGGAHNGGTIFSVSPAGLLTTLYSFSGGLDGFEPYGALTPGGSSGLFYGTTSSGGGTGAYGTAYELNLDTLPVDPGTVAFSTAVTGVNEDAGSAILSVTRTGGSTGAVKVGYATADSTAHAGIDYLNVTGLLNWADGDSSSRNVSIPLSDGGLSDGTKRAFLVRLVSPTGGATLGTPSTETVTITENDPPRPTVVTLSVLGDGTATVGGASAKVLFTRSGDDTAPLMVNYQVAGPAGNGTDYQNLSGSLTIPAGSSSAKLKIKANRNAPDHGTLTIKIVPIAPIDHSYEVEPPKVKVRFVNNG